jgi:TRAP-type mannitol/chloroaromatic compound transport system permease small subunit
MHALLKLAHFIDRLSEWSGRILYWLSLLMVLIGVYNASVRYIGAFIGRNLSSNFYLEAQWYLFGAMFLLGAAYGLRYNVHVRVDVLHSRWSERTRAWVELAGTLLFLLPFCAIVLWLSLDWVALSWQVRESSPNPGGLLRYPIKFVIPVAFVLLGLQGLAQAIKAVAVLTGQRERLHEEKASLEESIL